MEEGIQRICNQYFITIRLIFNYLWTFLNFLNWIRTNSQEQGILFLLKIPQFNFFFENPFINGKPKEWSYLFSLKLSKESCLNWMAPDARINDLN